MTRIDARVMKSFPARRGDKFSLDIHLESNREVIALLGPSGSGKSLSLNCLAGFVRPDDGRILVNDELYFDAGARVNQPPRRRRCGYIFQDHALFPHMNVRDNLLFAATSRASNNSGGQGRLLRRRAVNEFLESFELSSLADQRPAQLSGGQKQRAALARVLISEPQILLLDEPTRGLDARLRENFYQLLRTVREKSNVPVLLVTHDLNECFRLADYVCFMEKGRFVQTGAREEVFSRPANAAMARSLGIYNLISAEIRSLDPARNTSRIAAFGEEVEAEYLPGHLIGDRGFVCIRSSEVRLASECPAKANCFVLSVLRTTPSPQGVRIQLEHDLSLTVSQANWNALGNPEKLQVHIPPTAVYFLA